MSALWPPEKYRLVARQLERERAPAARAHVYGELDGRRGATCRTDPGMDARLTAMSFPASFAPEASGLMIGDYEALTAVGNTFAAVFQVNNADASNRTDIQLATFPG